MLQKLTRFTFVSLACLTLFAVNAPAQRTPTILSAAQLNRVVPAGFYFQGQSAPTQMRNAAAVRIGTDRHVIAALVDTSGYSADVRAKYEGFFITDVPLRINDRELEVGAYGFGFTGDGMMNVFDISGGELISVRTTNDRALRRPRPLMMANSQDGVRLYSGRAYVTFMTR